MKTPKLPIGLLVIAMAFALALNSCAKDDIISEQGIEDLNAISAKADKADIVVLPSGDLSGATDANAIESALAALPPGGVLLFKKGSFYINRTIQAPLGFSGTVTGKGKNKTAIVGVGDDVVPFQGSTLFLFNQPSETLTMKKMAISIPEGFATTSAGGNFNLEQFILVNLSATGSDVRFKNLELTGAEATPGTFPGAVYQPFDGIDVFGDFANFPAFTSGGDYLISNCKISKTAFEGHVFQSLKDASIRVKNNTYTEIKQTIYRFMDGCHVSIVGNNMKASEFGTIVVTQEGFAIPGDPTRVVIKDNKVVTEGFMPIEIGGVPEGGANFDLLIEDNELKNKGPGPLFGFPSEAVIGIFSNNDNAVVRDNEISGQARFGIVLGGDFSDFIVPGRVDNCKLVENEFEDFNAAEADYALFGDYNTIVDLDGASVLDEGIGNVILDDDDDDDDDDGNDTDD